MSSSTEKLLDEVLRLPPAARAALAAQLLDSLEREVDEDAEAAWAREIARPPGRTRRWPGQAHPVSRGSATDPPQRGCRSRLSYTRKPSRKRERPASGTPSGARRQPRRWAEAGRADRGGPDPVADFRARDASIPPEAFPVRRDLPRDSRNCHDRCLRALPTPPRLLEEALIVESLLVRPYRRSASGDAVVDVT